MGFHSPFALFVNYEQMKWAKLVDERGKRWITALSGPGIKGIKLNIILVGVAYFYKSNFFQHFRGA